jgi:hypothetical protein
MKAIVAFGLTVVLLAGPASGFAAVGSEQAREANAGNETRATDAQTTTPTSPTMSAPNVPSHDGNSQLGSTGRSQAQTSPGVTVGPGSTNHDDNRALGYGKGAGENSSVGKGR